MKNKSLLTTAALLAGLFTASTGQSAVLGQLWENNGNVSNATIANIPSTPSDASFYTSNINYDSNVGGYSIGGFLNNPTFFNTSGTFNAGDTANNVFYEFTGQTYLNAGINAFSTPHDDGFELVVTGAFSDSAMTVAFDNSQPGPTSAVTTAYDIYAPTAGLYTFKLAYGECCGQPAVLGFQVNGAPVNPVPEPATITLMGLGFAGIRLFRRKAA